MKERFDKLKNTHLDEPAETKTLIPMKRKPRQLKFFQPGKYIEKENKEPKHVQLEKLKQETAENVKKAGMKTELDISDKVLKVNSWTLCWSSGCSFLLSIFATPSGWTGKSTKILDTQIDGLFYLSANSW